MGTSEPEAGSGRGAGSSTPLPQFERVLRGFDPRAVTSFLKTVLGRVRDLELHVTDLQAQLDEAGKHTSARGSALGTSEDRYEAFSDHVANVVRAFDQDVERIRDEAEAEARRIVETAKARAENDTSEADERSREAKTEVERMLNDARTEADRIRTDAQAKAEEIKARADRALEEARVRAKDLISDLESRRDSLLAEMRSLHDRMLEAAGTFEPALEGQPAPVEDVTVSEDDVAVSEGTVERSGFFSRDG